MGKTSTLIDQVYNMLSGAPPLMMTVGTFNDANSLDLDDLTVTTAEVAFIYWYMGDPLKLQKVLVNPDIPMSVDTGVLSAVLRGTDAFAADHEFMVFYYRIPAYDVDDDAFQYNRMNPGQPGTIEDLVPLDDYEMTGAFAAATAEIPGGGYEETSVVANLTINTDTAVQIMVKGLYGTGGDEFPLNMNDFYINQETEPFNDDTANVLFYELANDADQALDITITCRRYAFYKVYMLSTQGGGAHAAIADAGYIQYTGGS